VGIWDGELTLGLEIGEAGLTVGVMLQAQWMQEGMQEQWMVEEGQAMVASLQMSIASLEMLMV
jgi:hypothetical protein